MSAFLVLGLVFSATCHICMSCLCYEHDVRLSLGLSVMLVTGFNHIAQKNGNQCFGYLCAEANPHHTIL